MESLVSEISYVVVQIQCYYFSPAAAVCSTYQVLKHIFTGKTVSWSSNQNKEVQRADKKETTRVVGGCCCCGESINMTHYFPNWLAKLVLNWIWHESVKYNLRWESRWCGDSILFLCDYIISTIANLCHSFLLVTKWGQNIKLGRNPA